MSNSHLRACPTCARHVRVRETACPFCGAALSEAFRASPAPKAPSTRLGRAALYALGAGSMSVAAACSNTVDVPLYGGPPVDSGPEDAGADRVATPAYGAPADAAPFDTGADQQPMPHYGGPPIDSGTDAPQTIDAAYGGPPIDSGTD